jgi:hypothetical protein
MNRKTINALLISAFALASAAHADVGVGLRAGTLGYGADMNIGLTDKLTVRVGYDFFAMERDFEETDVTYEGDVDLQNAHALLDWHPFASGFRLSVGAVGPGLKADVIGRPQPGGTYDIGDSTYTAAQIGSLTGQLKFGNSVAPYVGLGWGNVAGKNHRVTFLFDLGAAYIGKSTVTLNATCGATLSALQCTQLQNQLRNDLVQEQTEMETDAAPYAWWPVIKIGLGVRF